MEISEPGDEKGKGQGTSPIEWLVAAVSLVIVLGVIVILIFEAFTDPVTPPILSIRTERIVETRYGYIVEFQVENAGYATAASLLVEGELAAADSVLETSEVTIDFVPAESRRKAGLFFKHDPRRYHLTIEPRGYDEP